MVPQKHMYQNPIAIILSLLLATSSLAQLDLVGGGLTLVEEGPIPIGGVPTNLATGAVPFASSELGPQLGIGFHLAANLNDQVYGNSNSWIGADANPFPDPFAGIDLGASPVTNVQSIAFGRDSTLTFLDRSAGLYTLQYTQVASPSTDLGLGTTGDPTTGWTDIGTLNYGASSGAGTNYNNVTARHRYNFNPIDATGVRLLVPGTGLGGGTAIDEIELYDVAGAFVDPPAPPPPFGIVPVGSFNVTWDGNDGEHFDAASPAVVPNNVALASNGAVPFTSSDLGPTIGVDFHVAANINDGFYGNANSWIGAAASGDYAGVDLGSAQAITSIAWGRDNGNGQFDDSDPGTDCCGGQLDDRWAGSYTLEYTLADDPANAAVTGDAATGWAEIATVSYSAIADVQPGDGFTPYLRHEFGIDDGGNAVLARGIRLSGLAGGVAIDELEVYAVPEPTTLLPPLLGMFVLLTARRR
ncbi:MAG: hypothetical protein KDB27_13370 [Planctomycetales bacterium]|nr:hypothetical protein [Planctomycetales bacterium]